MNLIDVFDLKYQENHYFYVKKVLLKERYRGISGYIVGNKEERLQEGMILPVTRCHPCQQKGRCRHDCRSNFHAFYVDFYGEKCVCDFELSFPSGGKIFK